MRIEKTCEHCGKVVEVIPSRAERFRFCSKSCREAAYAAKEEICICKQCGKTFIRAQNTEGLFCSRECSAEFRRKDKDKAPKKRITKEYEPRPDKQADTPKRQCHGGCGKLITNWMCDECWAKRRRGEVDSDQTTYDVNISPYGQERAW